MAILVKTEKIINRGQASRIILDIEALGKNDLPYEYMEGTPRCWKEGPALKVREGGYLGKCLIIDRIYCEEDFQKILKKIQACGSRLREINLQIRKSERTWKGEEIFII